MNQKTIDTVDTVDNTNNDTNEVWLEGFIQPFRAPSDETNANYKPELVGKFNVPGVVWSNPADNIGTRYLQSVTLYTDLLQIGADYTGWKLSISSTAVSSKVTDELIKLIQDKFTDALPIAFGYCEFIKVSVLVHGITNDQYKSLLVKDIKFLS